MPRVSASALAVNGSNGHGIETVRRPGPPSELDKDEQQVWIDTVQSMEAGWFPKETHGLLTQYCRQILRARFIAKLIKDMQKVRKDRFKIGEYRRLLRDEARVVHNISVLARNMRLSQGSTSRQEYVKKRPMTVKPWDDDNEEINGEA
jgi:hypothetical protein